MPIRNNVQVAIKRSELGVIDEYVRPFERSCDNERYSLS